MNIDAAFDQALADYPLLSIKSLASVGYVGFRVGTQIDPIWNAYLLALVLEIAADIEDARVHKSKNIVFSYRFMRDTERLTLFDASFGWSSYQSNALAKAESVRFVLSTDITDFYPRIYHHRLENALQQTTSNKEAVRRVILLLSRLASDSSYGLPVGGNAARILAELLLNRVDRLLLSHGVDFSRFVDDYFIYADNRAEAQSALVMLSEALLTEGLALSRSKTRLGLTRFRGHLTLTRRGVGAPTKFPPTALHCPFTEPVPNPLQHSILRKLRIKSRKMRNNRNFPHKTALKLQL